MVQEEQEGRQEKEQERPGENGPAGEAEEASAEEQTATAEEEQIEPGEEESEPVEEAEEIVEIESHGGELNSHAKHGDQDSLHVSKLEKEADEHRHNHERIEYNHGLIADVDGFHFFSVLRLLHRTWGPACR